MHIANLCFWVTQWFQFGQSKIKVYIFSLTPVIRNVLWSICHILLEKRNGIICETCKPCNFLKYSHPGFGICSGILSCMCSHIEALIGYSAWYLFQQPYLHNAWAAYAFTVLISFISWSQHVLCIIPCIMYDTGPWCVYVPRMLKMCWD